MARTGAWIAVNFSAPVRIAFSGEISRVFPGTGGGGGGADVVSKCICIQRRSFSNRGTLTRSSSSTVGRTLPAAVRGSSWASFFSKSTRSIKKSPRAGS